MNVDLNHDYQIAIHEAYDEDAPRLIYADWLEERGDSLCELIRLQCRIESLDRWDLERYHLQRRERRMLASHGQQWRARIPAPSQILWGDFSRGMLDVAQAANLTALIRRGPALHQAAPTVRQITVLHSDRAEIPLPRSREFPWLHALALPPRALSREKIPDLLESPLLSSLRSLRLADQDLTDVEIQVLASAYGLQGLRHLDLSENRLNLVNLRELGNGLFASELASITLRVLQAPDHSSSALWRLTAEIAESFPALESLDVAGNDWGERALEVLVSGRYWPRLRALNLSGNFIIPLNVKTIVENPCFHNLEVCCLDGAPLQSRGAAMLAQSGGLEKLKKLSLRRVILNNKAAKTFSQAEFLPHLRELDLSGNPLEDGVEAIAQRAESLAWWSLRDCGLGDEAAEMLAHSEALENLLFLDLKGNPIRKQGRRALEQSPYLKNAEILYS